MPHMVFLGFSVSLESNCKNNNFYLAHSLQLSIGIIHFNLKNNAVDPTRNKLIPLKFTVLVL